MENVQAFLERVKTDIHDEKSEEEIFQSFLTIFGKDPETTVKVAELLAAIPHEKVAKLLRRMLEASEEKKVRKTIKRSLYRLKSRGIATEEVSLAKGESILRPLQAESKQTL